MISDSKDLASRLLSVSGITRVISIDDWYAKSFSLEEAVGSVDLIDEGTLRSLLPLEPLRLEYTDNEIIKTQVRDRWDQLTPVEQQRAWAMLVTARGHVDENSKALENDYRTGSSLSELFDQSVLRLLSLSQWEKEKDSLIKDDMPNTLLLVDENFKEEEGGTPHRGLTIIDGLLRAQPAQKIVCALLSNGYSMSTIHADWKALSDEHKFNRSRFVLIPKDSISSDHQRFLALIKLAIFNEKAEKMKIAVNGLYADAMNEAQKKTDQIDIYEFEQIVCDSSSKEGVWEPETLIRVHSLFHKQETRRQARLNHELHLLSDDLRKVNQLAFAAWESPTPSAIQIHKLEWYETAEEVNGQLMPTDVGDIFEIHGKTSRRYILATQPCDLMVRSNGKRNGYTNEGLLLEMMRSTGKTLPPATTYPLAFYGDGNNSDWYVNLKAAHYVDLNILDLCAINEGGIAKIVLNGEPSPRLTPAWRAREKRLAKFAEDIFRRYESIVSKGVDPQEATAVATTHWLGKLFAGDINQTNRKLSYNFARVGRLRQPRSATLLSRYAGNMAREAFEHELAERDASDGPISRGAPDTKSTGEKSQSEGQADSKE